MMRRLRYPAATLLACVLALTALNSPAEAQETTIEVELGSFYIDMPETIPAGPLTLEVTNVSEMPHTITIEGNGETLSMPETLVPAGPTSTTWEIDLAPGTYTIWCPIGAHRDQGMEVTITVEGDEPAVATEAMVEPTETSVPVDTSYLDEVADEPDPTADTAPAAVAGDTDSDDGVSTVLLIALGAGVIAIAAVGGGFYYRRSNMTE